MKNFSLNLIAVYQKHISPLLHQLLGQKNLCLYQISCSEYAKKAIVKHGLVKGGKLAFFRLLSCQPFIKTKSYANI